jgi:transposase
VAAYKKNAADLGAHIVFLDESGFLLIPTVRRTWAPRGHTPILYHHQKRERISVISALSVSPRRRRIALFFRCLPGENFDSIQVASFLRHLLRHLRGFVIVVLDNGACHKGEAMRAFLRRQRRIRLEPLPPYAPEINPDEGVWNQARSILSNGRPDTSSGLMQALEETLSEIGTLPHKLRWCFHQSDLPPFLP